MSKPRDYRNVTTQQCFKTIGMLQLVAAALLGQSGLGLRECKALITECSHDLRVIERGLEHIERELEP